MKKMNLDAGFASRAGLLDETSVQKICALLSENAQARAVHCESNLRGEYWFYEFVLEGEDVLLTVAEDNGRCGPEAHIDTTGMVNICESTLYPVISCIATAVYNGSRADLYLTDCSKETKRWANLVGALPVSNGKLHLERSRLIVAIAADFEP